MFVLQRLIHSEHLTHAPCLGKASFRRYRICPVIDFRKLSDTSFPKGALKYFHLRPHFFLRLRAVSVYFQIRQIVRLQLKGISDLLKQQDVSMNVSESAVDLLASAGFDPEFGARPVKRALQRLLLNDLSKNLLSGKIDRTKPIHVDAANGSLVFTNE